MSSPIVPRTRFWVLPMLAMVIACVIPNPSHASSTAPTAPPIRILSTEVEDQGRVRVLAAGEPLHAGQTFALRLASTSTEPLYLYLIIEHSHQRRVMLYPAPGAPPPATPAGSLRLPQPEDWFSLEQTEPGDRLCLISSERPINDFSCTDDAPDKSPSRSEDKPPPKVKTPPPQKVEPPPPPPPPPSDRDAVRGRKKWVLRLPFVA